MLYVTQLSNAAAGITQAALHYLCALDAAGWYDNVRIHQLGGVVRWADMPAWAAGLSRATPYHADQRHVALIHHTPDAVAHPHVRFGERANIGLTVCETDRLPSWVVSKLNDLDAVVTASRWNATVLADSGVYKPVHVVPHAMGPYWWGPSRYNVPTNKPYVFYYVGNWVSRKNPEGVIRAYIRAFPQPSGDRQLLLKLSGSAGATDFVQALIAQEAGGDRPDIRVYNEYWDEHKIGWIHAMGDCCVSLHHGEGWGYAPFQAALLGKAVIATGWSAPVEYLGGASNYLVGSRLVPIGDLGGAAPYFQSTDAQPLRWAEPDLDDAVHAFRYMAQTQPKASPVTVAALREDFQWRTVGRRLVEVLQEYV